MFVSEMTNSDNFSKGCQLCQEGKWLCIYLTHLCDAGCKFCPSPHNDDRIYSGLGNDYQEILKHIENQDYSGISFSGGDPFKVFDRLLEWLNILHNHLPHYYFWIYSSGLGVSEEKIRLLADAGLHEIRFNIAAMNYHSGNIIQTIRLARKYLGFVSIEIPSIPEDFEKLAGILPILDDLGVDYLNLHEYILTPALEEQNIDHGIPYRLNYEVDLRYHAGSRGNTEQIIKYCMDRKLNIQINNCSLVKKENQMKMRRIKMGELFTNEFTALTDDGFLVSYASVPAIIEDRNLDSYISNEDPDGFDNYIINPEKIYEGSPNITSTVIKLTFLPPIDLKSKRRLINVEIVGK